MTSLLSAQPRQAQASLSAWLSAKRQLPIPPSVFMKLMELGRRLDASPNDYTEIITTSASLAGRLLAAVNSSWFGVRHHVRNISQAVNLLGTVNVRLLAVAHCVAAAHEDIRLDKRVLDRHWQAGLIKAVAGEHYACRLDGRAGDEAFLLGLMQDMVMPVMHELCPDLYERNLAVWSPAEQCRIEQERFGMDHACASSLLAENYGLPPTLCQILRDHHNHEALSQQTERAVLAQAVHFAGLFPHAFGGWDSQEAQGLTTLLQDKFADLSEPVDDVLAHIQRRFGEVVACIRPSAGGEIDLTGLLRQATGEVVETTVSLVGRVHALMANAVQADSQLTAASVEALRLRETSQQDPLTGLLNRRGLEVEGRHAVQSARQSGHPLAVLFADVDKFKSINDVYGHEVGDKVLQHVAGVLTETFGPSAIVGRFGGDEFVIVLAEAATARQAKALAVGLLEAVGQGLATSPGTTIPLRISVGGLWCTRLTEQVDWTKLVATTDQLMYRAKQQEGNQVVFIELATSKE
jgi:diguanylate cyclase (GGDEF)-like protein